MQECIIPVAFLFEVTALRYVFYRRDPSALRQRLIDDESLTPVRGFDDSVDDFTVCDVAHNV